MSKEQEYVHCVISFQKKGFAKFSQVLSIPVEFGISCVLVDKDQQAIKKDVRVFLEALFADVRMAEWKATMDTESEAIKFQRKLLKAQEERLKETRTLPPT